MEFHHREYFISRIIMGDIKLKIRDGLVLIIKTPTITQYNEAQEYFQEVREKAFLDGVMVSREIDEMMIEEGVWSRQHDSDIKRITEQIDDFKVDLYKSSFDSKKQKRTRIAIRRAESALEDYLSKKHHYDAMSCNGVASYARWCWIVENCTYQDNKLYYFNEISVSAVLSRYQSEMLSDKQIRELAKTDPWRSIWAASQKSRGVLFEEPATRYTTEQKNLILWSSMYDSIAESPESPSEDIIQDDDMLDGWLIIQRRERETNQKQKAAEDMISNEKIANSDEVFIVARSEEDIDNIDSLNDPRAKAIKESRKEFANSKDRTKHQDLPDVQRELQMLRNKAFIESVKNKS